MTRFRRVRLAHVAPIFPTAAAEEGKHRAECFGPRTAAKNFRGVGRMA